MCCLTTSTYVTDWPTSVCTGSSQSCREHLLQFSLERADVLHLRGAYPHFPRELQDEIALIDP